MGNQNVLFDEKVSGFTFRPNKLSYTWDKCPKH
ncbi:hypothetical protein AciX8_3468 [Granulicella mallensis MP5ACTX8]|uniref:Uncharacterized protein n=1 Tax=Granulicella mallensis (strain ATCC BAA-1857 / DSM 23137 / MP5ACTX8) TaxID=682795 RepID=G8NWG2_GRAMM|nr:hypothetical protein AciX8_3468 [Granulicella mallensis MP5ACTX8]